MPIKKVKTLRKKKRKSKVQRAQTEEWANPIDILQII
jgi:hypothetical protein